MMLKKWFVLSYLLISIHTIGFSKDRIKILLIGHKPDHAAQTHTYLPTLQVIAKCLNQNKGIDAIVSDGWPGDSSVLENVRGIVLYSSPGADILLANNIKEQFLHLLDRGIGFTAIHWSTGASEENGDTYQKILGGWFNFSFSTLKIDSLLLQQIDPQHPVCNGWTPYTLKDEFYINLKFDSIHPILQVNVDSKEQIVAWTYQRMKNNGRSFGTTLGHFAVNFSNKNFRKAIINGILWTVNKQIPKRGAKCRISKADVNLMMGDN